MLRLRPVLPLAVVLALPITLGGCVGALVVGGLAAAGGVGYEAANERGVEGTVDDYTLKNNIEDAWIKADPHYMNAFTATVYNGRVLLTGDAAGPEMKRRAVAIAERVPGVRRVYDQIEVTRTPSAWDDAQDAWITAQVHSRLVLERGVRSDNYKVETANRSVYLIGSARSQAEIDRATSAARYVPGVRRVVSYVRIRPGLPATAVQTPPMPAQGPGGYAPPPNGSGGYAPPSGPSAAPAPIQVQPL